MDPNDHSSIIYSSQDMKPTCLSDEWIKMWYIFACMGANLLQSCPTLCDPMECSLPGSSVHGILQARILE